MTVGELRVTLNRLNDNDVVKIFESYYATGIEKDSEEDEQ